MKKMLKTSMSIILIIAFVTGCGCIKKEESQKKQPIEEVKVNTNKDVVKDQQIDGIKITNTSIITTKGISKLVASVTNNSDKDYKLDEYVIIIKDKEGIEMVRIPGYVGDTIAAGETRIINSSVDRDLSNAGSVEYEVKK